MRVYSLENDKWNYGKYFTMEAVGIFSFPDIFHVNIYQSIIKNLEATPLEYVIDGSTQPARGQLAKRPRS